MLAVIFRARVAQLDDEYHAMAALLRDKALKQYRCTDFISCQQGDQELTVSYWNNEQDIKSWRQDTDHQRAQLLGKQKWYASFRVEIVEIQRHYVSKQDKNVL